MYRLIFISFFLLISTALFSQPNSISTTGDNSPAVVAKNINIKYGVSTEIVLELLKIYQQQGLSVEARNKKAEQLISNYKKMAPSEALNPAKKQALGVDKDAAAANVLDWDIFLSTKGKNSPAIYSKGGTVGIWYGITPEAFKSVFNQLSKDFTKIDALEDQLEKQVKEVKELRTQLTIRANSDSVAARALKYIDKGEFAAAEKILKEDLTGVNKEVAYKNYVLAKTLVLEMKYTEATEYFTNAVTLDKKNEMYALDYGQNLLETGKPTDAIKYFKLAASLGKEQEQLADAHIKTGLAFYQLDQLDSALSYYLKSLEVNVKMYGDNHPGIAPELSNIGLVYAQRGQFVEAYRTLFKAFYINYEAYGSSPIVVTNLNNLGTTFSSEKKNSDAIYYLEEAVKMEKQLSSVETPSIAVTYSNLANVYGRVGKITKALELQNLSLQINLKYFGNEHPKVATNYNNLGMIHLAEGKPAQAVQELRRGLAISKKIFGDDHYQVIGTYHNLALAYADNEQHDSAFYFFDKAVVLNTAKKGGESIEVGLSYIDVADLYKKKSDFTNALDYYTRSKKILLKYYPGSSAEIQFLDSEIKECSSKR
jgi:tetratricopeptide (TPR) repeat protein